METKLARISQMSRENPELVFTSIFHLINVELLKECHEEMDGDKAVGIDGITKAMYAGKLDSNLESLVNSLRKLSHKPGRRCLAPRSAWFEIKQANKEKEPTR